MRLFVALEIPNNVRRSVHQLVEQLRPKCASPKWVRAESMHLTLKFIGHVETERLGAIRDALARVHAAAPVAVQFRGMGFFPNERRPRVLWVGVEAAADLVALAARADEMLAAIGIPSEAREYSPHLTLARFNSHDLHQRGKAPDGLADVANDVKNAAGRTFGSLTAREFHLFESKLKPSGAEYKRLETFAFVKAD